MKLLTLLILATLTLNVFASSIDTSGLHDLEIQAIQESTTEERALLVECLLDEKTMVVDNTSCINDVFGDVHN